MPQDDLGLVRNDIVSLTKSGTGAPGTVDTYTFTLRSGATFSFQVTNGANGGTGGVEKHEFTTVSDFTDWYITIDLSMLISVAFFDADYNSILCYIDNGGSGTKLYKLLPNGNMQELVALSSGEKIVAFYKIDESTTIDDELSSSSVNPVQNRAIFESLDESISIGHQFIPFQSSPATVGKYWASSGATWDTTNEYYAYSTFTIPAGTYYWNTGNTQDGNLSGNYTWVKVGDGSYVKLNSISSNYASGVNTFSIAESATVRATAYLSDSVSPRYVPRSYLTNTPKMPTGYHEGWYSQSVLTNADGIVDLNKIFVTSGGKSNQYTPFDGSTAGYYYSNASGGVSVDQSNSFFIYPAFTLAAGTYYYKKSTASDARGGVSSNYSWIKIGSASGVKLSSISQYHSNEVNKFTIAESSTLYISGAVPTGSEGAAMAYAFITDNPQMPNGYGVGEYLPIIDEYARKHIEDIEENIEVFSETVINVGSTRTYTTIQDAVGSIADNNAANRYIILVDNGTYDITNAGIDFIPLKPYVKIQGQSKKGVVLSFQPTSTDNTKNVFQNASSGFLGGTSEVCNMTIVTKNVKGALHLDDSGWVGKVYFHDVIIDDKGMGDEFDDSLDYYVYFAASAGSINLGLHRRQHVVIENIVTNGYIYSHTAPSTIEDGIDVNMESSFTVKDCICDWLCCSGSGDIVLKNCVFEGNKCKFLKILFNDYTGNDYFCWDIALKNNKADFMEGLYRAYGSNSFTSLWEHFGSAPFADPSLHAMVRNNTSSVISRRTKVVFTDETKRFIEPATGDEYDAITMEDFSASGGFGIVQYGGDLGAYWDYLQTHEVS